MLEDRNFFERFEQNKEKLTKKQKVVAEYIWDNYKTVVLLSSIPLSKKLGVSEATVIRTAYQLGYKGFADMLQDLKDYVGREIKSRECREASHSSSIEQVISNGFEVLENIREEIDGKFVERFCRSLENKKRILVCGSRKSSIMAKRLSEYLSNYFNHVSYMDINEDRIYSFLSEADNEMMLIYIEFEKLEDIYVKMLKMFIESRTEVFVFSNQKSLNRISAWVDFFCEMPSVDENDIKDVESFCYIMFIFQIFILEYSKINKEKIKKRLDAIENLKNSIEKAPD